MIAPASPRLTTTLPAAQASAIRAAKTASVSPHALINLVRLIKGIESRAPEVGATGDSPVLDLKKRDQEVLRDRENLIYAKALLSELSGQNEQSSSTSQTLAQLASSISSLEAAYDAYTPSIEHPIPSVPLSRHQSRIPTASESSLKTPAPEPEIKPVTAKVESASRIRQRKTRTGPSLSTYLAKREREDAQGGEAGLSPVALSRQVNGSGRNGVDAEKQREELLAGNTSRAALSGAQLHEELGGQLAQMSIQLKRNALHFANSLEEEKAILETSQAALEGNLEKTQTSKTQLSAVTRSSRGTTCMTIGIVLLVLIIFVWTYMLIRFT